MENSFLKSRLSALLDVYLANVRLDGFYAYSWFKSMSIVSQCPVKMKILATKNRGPSNGPPKTKWLISAICGVIYLSIYGCTVLLLDLGRFFSSLILYIVGRTPWMGGSAHCKAATYT
jgi:hypothetical protein